MNENTVVISQKRYEELIKAELKLNIIYVVASNDISSYGYSEGTSKLIDSVLEVERSSKE